MRSRAGRRNGSAIVIVLLAIVAIGVLIGVKAVVAEVLKNNKMADDQVTELSQLEQKKEKKEEKKVEVKYDEPKPEQKVAVKASIQFTVPKIMDDDKVEAAKEVKSQDKLQQLKGAIASMDYAGDVGGKGTVDQLLDNQKPGGTQAAPKEEEVADNALVEVPATYPGGEAALLAFVSKNLVYPSIAQEQELQGTVVLRFKVGKDGSVEEVRIRQGLSKECDAAAVAVVKKLNRFIPAKSQGHPVPVWFTLPIRFRIQ